MNTSQYGTGGQFGKVSNSYISNTYVGTGQNLGSSPPKKNSLSRRFKKAPSKSSSKLGDKRDFYKTADVMTVAEEVAERLGNAITQAVVGTGRDVIRDKNILYTLVVTPQSRYWAKISIPKIWQAAQAREFKTEKNFNKRLKVVCKKAMEILKKNEATYSVLQIITLKEKNLPILIAQMSYKVLTGQ